MGRDMGNQTLNKLSARTVTTKQTPGLYSDGGQLYLQVAPTGSKTWIFRYKSPVTLKTRDMGLGPIHTVGLPDAREKAASQRSLLNRGLDPIETREAEIRQRATEAAKAVTFSHSASAYIESHKAGWKNKKHADQWEHSIRVYCKPTIGDLPIQAIDTGLVLKILEPIWATKSETASRVRGRIESILDWARVRGYRFGENPARWKGHLSELLPKLAVKERVVHLKAMPYPEVAGLVSNLRARSGVSSRCLEFTLLTAVRTCEAIYARPEEFNLDSATWTIPASRMKMKKEHRVPLPPRAVEIVREMLQLENQFIFPGERKGKSISNMAMLKLLERMEIDVTVHGFRSSFRDWAAERTGFSHEVCEMALAHSISNAAEAAYRRGDLFDKRRNLMEAWADFINTERQESALILFRQAA